MNQQPQRAVHSVYEKQLIGLPAALEEWKRVATTWDHWMAEWDIICLGRQNESVENAWIQVATHMQRDANYQKRQYTEISFSLWEISALLVTHAYTLIQRPEELRTVLEPNQDHFTPIRNLIRWDTTSAFRKALRKALKRKQQ
eukprot:3936774-Rhodomonas_salina.1